ncbi:MAG TPA: hypothetical protein VEH31_31205, partial [Streptosporangiaceae bacterium]|nr:hypothetical protein [Streptosporangiaceae bacterium]
SRCSASWKHRPGDLGSWQLCGTCGNHQGMAAVFAYVSAALVAAWGLAHAIPTRQVLASFAPITADNRRIILQEWLAEAFTMRGIAVIVIAATAAPGTSDIRAWVYRAASTPLVGLGTLTALTGARTPVIWFKICPALLAVAALLLLLASLQ